MREEQSRERCHERGCAGGTTGARGRDRPPQRSRPARLVAGVGICAARQEDLGHGEVAGTHRLMQRRDVVPVARIGVGAMIEQQSSYLSRRLLRRLA